MAVGVAALGCRSREGLRAADWVRDQWRCHLVTVAICDRWLAYENNRCSSGTRGTPYLSISGEHAITPFGRSAHVGQLRKIGLPSGTRT